MIHNCPLCQSENQDTYTNYNTLYFKCDNCKLLAMIYENGFDIFYKDFRFYYNGQYSCVEFKGQKYDFFFPNLNQSENFLNKIKMMQVFK